MTKHTLMALWVASSLALSPTPALAKGGKKDVAGAVKADKQGQGFEKKKQWEDAKAAYEKSLELNDSADTRIRLAAVEAKLGHFVAARGQLEQALGSKTLSFASRVKAQQLQKSIEKKMPSIALELPTGFRGKVTLDGEELGNDALAQPVPVDPGSHKVRAEAEGYKTFSQTLDVQEKEKKNLTILMTEEGDQKPAKSAPEEEAPVKKQGHSNTLAYVSIGVGAAGVVVGTVMALQAKSTKSELDGACNNNVCPENQRDLYDKGKQQANIATVGFVVGAVGLGLGTVLLLSGGKSEGAAKMETARRTRPQVTPFLGPGSVGVFGKF